jgi:hypothetical protein
MVDTVRKGENDDDDDDNNNNNNNNNLNLGMPHSGEERIFNETRYSLYTFALLNMQSRRH